MSNEILFAVFLFGGLGVALGASYFGRIYLYAYIVTITLYIGITEAKVIEVFGFPTTLGTALYGVTFFATDMLTERYGKRAGFEAIRFSIFAAVFFQIFLQLTLMTNVIPDMAEVGSAMNVVFGTSFRIVFAGLFVYLISQSFDVWFYHKIHERTGDKHLWLRNNGSTFVSQAIDTYLFTFLAFSPQVSSVLNLVSPGTEYFDFPDWIAMATVGYCFKLVVAVSDTPFMYLNKMFIPRDLKNQAASAS